MIRAWRAAGPTVRWLLVFGVAVLAVLAGSGPARARTVSATNSTACTVPSFFYCLHPTTTTTPYTPPPPPPSTTTVEPTTTTTAPPGSTTTTTVAVAGTYSEAFLPCGTPSGPCRVPPKQVEVTYPVVHGAPSAVIAWQKGVSDAPQPESPSVTLDPAQQVPCSGAAKAAAGEQQECWPWPGGLMDKGFILNGTYHLTPAGQKAAAIGLAVPPAAPRQVVATATTDSVAVSWQPSAAPEPDLTGYALTRNGQAVYYCSTDGLGPGAHTACPSPLAITDHPGVGKWTYAVSALRLGVDDASADSVGSPLTAAAPGAVTLTAVATRGPEALSPVGLAPLPSSVGSVESPSTGAATAADPGALGSGGPGAPPATAPVKSLQYPASDNPVVGKSSQLALKVGEPGPQTDVVPVGVLALGIIALAIAAHFLYLRVQLGLAEARVAERRRRGL